MPSSSHLQISLIMEWILHLRPKSVLDVGVGNGRYGFLCRETLDDPFDSPPKRITLRGIEGYAPYIRDIHRLIYDEILLGDCTEVVNTHNERYDLALLIDVIEHLEKPRAHALLSRLLELSRNVIVATPHGFAPQDDVNGNSFEIHRSGWRKGDFAAYPDNVFALLENKVVCLVGKDGARLRRSLYKGKITRLIHGNKLVGSTFRIAKSLGLTDLKAIRSRLGFEK